MRALSSRLALLLFLAVLTTLVGCSPGASAAGCTLQDPGPFTICTPPAWVLSRGRGDSAVGNLTHGNLRVVYDFGLNSDPLLPEAGRTEASESPIKVDGHAARAVRYQLGAIHYFGVHVPQISTTSMGSLKLTILASSVDPDQLKTAEAAIGTVRFKAAGPKP